MIYNLSIRTGNATKSDVARILLVSFSLGRLLLRSSRKSYAPSWPVKVNGECESVRWLGGEYNYLVPSYMECMSVFSTLLRAASGLAAEIR